MKTKFIKIQDTIVNVNDILSIHRHGQLMIIECTNNEHNIYFSSEQAAQEEVNRIYSILKQ